MCQTLFHTPRHHRHQWWFLHARAVVIIAHVEQAHLVCIGRLGRSVLKRCFHTGQQTGTVEVDAVEGTGLDQSLYGALVHTLLVDTRSKVK